MAFTKDEKTQMMAQYREWISKSQAVVLVEYNKMTQKDVDTIRALENAIMEFNGCVMVISHDRFFLNRICTHLMVFEGEGKIRWFEGNFEEYEEKHRQELGGREESRRSKYKKLTRVS